MSRKPSPSMSPIAGDDMIVWFTYCGNPGSSVPFHRKTSMAPPSGVLIGGPSACVSAPMMTSSFPSPSMSANAGADHATASAPGRFEVRPAGHDHVEESVAIDVPERGARVHLGAHGDGPSRHDRSVRPEYVDLPIHR